MYYALDILAAIIIDWIIGDPYGFPHPVIYIGKLISALQKKARALSKDNNKLLKALGGGIVLIVASLSFLVPFFLLYFTRGYVVLHHSVNIIILWTTIACKCLKNEAKKVYTELEKYDLKEARVKLSYIVGRETSSLTEHEVIRADVETVAENSADGVIAPIFYAMIGGPYGSAFAMMYKGINTMDSMLGYLTEKYKYIGFFPAKVDDLFNLIPARITGILISLSAPIVRGNVLESLRIMIRDRKNHKSPNCAYSEGAVAGALGIELGGTNVYFGEVVYKPTIGDKKRKIERKDILKANKLLYVSTAVSCQIFILISVAIFIIV